MEFRHYNFYHALKRISFIRREGKEKDSNVENAVNRGKMCPSETLTEGMMMLYFQRTNVRISIIKQTYFKKFILSTAMLKSIENINQKGQMFPYAETQNTPDVFARVILFSFSQEVAPRST